jgi:hypothetical protein
MGGLHRFSALLRSPLLNASILIQCTKEGAYIPFSLSNSTTIKSTINSYLTALNLLNVFLSTKDESLKAQGPLYNTSALHSHQHVNVFAQQFQGVSKFWCWRCPTVSSRCAGSLDVLWMLLHHTPRLERFHGLLSMSSCTVCPCFCIVASFSQLASSTGWFFHFTR